MKRKETLFEQKLIKNGWKLAFKGYDDKTSQKIVTYFYIKEFNFSDVIFHFRVVLDNKREKVVDLYFFSVANTINRYVKKLIDHAWQFVEKELGKIYTETLKPNKKVENDDNDDNELVETLEAIEECE